MRYLVAILVASALTGAMLLSHRAFVARIDVEARAQGVEGAGGEIDGDVELPRGSSLLVSLDLFYRDFRFVIIPLLYVVCIAVAVLTRRR